MNNHAVSNHRAFLLHLQLLDSALPVGAFSHSFGFETFAAHGDMRTPKEIFEFCQSLLHLNLCSVDGLLIKGTFTLENSDLWHLDTLIDAARLAKETRDGLRKIGKQALRLGKNLAPEQTFSGLEAAFKNGECPCTWPLVYGIWARAIGVNADTAVAGYLHGSCAALLNGAVRLSIIGQSNAQIILARLAPEIESAWARVQNENPFNFWSSTPHVEWAQMAHETLDPRLFMS